MNSLIKSVTSSVLRRVIQRKAYSGVRTLFNAQYLGIDLFLDAREAKKKSFGNIADNFVNRMRQQVENASPTSLVFTEDLKAIVYLADESSLDVCLSMLRRFHKQNKELRFGTFVFGPVIMRLLHHLDKPDVALQLMKDPELSVFFSQIRSYLVVMDLMFESGMYQEVLNLNDQLAEQQLVDSKFPRDTVVLALAACYKLNTPESFQYASDLITKTREAGSFIVRRALHFAIALALNQNKPDVAMELLSNLNTSNYVTNHNLRLKTLAKLGRFDDVLAILRAKVEQDVPAQSAIRGNICDETLSAVKEALVATGDTELIATYDQLYTSLQEQSAITSQTVDDLLLAPIAPRPERNFEDKNQFGYRRRSFAEEREEPFFRRSSNFRYRERAYSGGISGE